MLMRIIGHIIVSHAVDWHPVWPMRTRKVKVMTKRNFNSGIQSLNSFMAVIIPFWRCHCGDAAKPFTAKLVSLAWFSILRLTRTIEYDFEKVYRASKQASSGTHTQSLRTNDVDLSSSAPFPFWCEFSNFSFDDSEQMQFGFEFLKTFIDIYVTLVPRESSHHFFRRRPILSLSRWRKNALRIFTGFCPATVRRVSFARRHNNYSQTRPGRRCWLSLSWHSR